MEHAHGGVIGFDVGLSGAVAAVDGIGNLVGVHDMPTVAITKTKTRNVINEVELLRLVLDLATQVYARVAIIEQVGSRPGEGVVSAFRFGESFGLVRGIVAVLKRPVVFVTPPTWKKHFNLGRDKDESRIVASRLWPGKSELFARKKDDGRAEAALIARYAHDQGLFIERAAT